MTKQVGEMKIDSEVCDDAVRAGIKDVTVIQRLNQLIDTALYQQLLMTNAPTSVADVRSRISDQLATVQLLSTQHSQLLAAFKSQHPNIEFPALHKELFSQEGIESDSSTPQR